MINLESVHSNVMSPVLKQQAFQEAAAMGESIVIVPTIPVYVADNHAVTTTPRILRRNIISLLQDECLTQSINKKQQYFVAHDERNKTTFKSTNIRHI